MIQSQPTNGDVVFDSSLGDMPIVGHRKMWLKIAKLGDLPADITPHVLRHSFACLATALGYNEPTIATFLGHKTQSITGRYVHSADAVASATMKLIGRKGHRSGFGPSATTVAGSASRWISHVGRIQFIL